MSHQTFNMAPWIALLCISLSIGALLAAPALDPSIQERSYRLNIPVFSYNSEQYIRVNPNGIVSADGDIDGT